jgi:hypothetical protein
MRGPHTTTLTWRKSSRSAANGHCVEIMELPGGIAVRDSKDPDGPRLRFDADAWNAFVGSLRP